MIQRKETFTAKQYYVFGELSKESVSTKQEHDATKKDCTSKREPDATCVLREDTRPQRRGLAPNQTDVTESLGPTSSEFTGIP